MTASQALNGFGTTFGITDGAGGFTVVAEIGDITLPNTTRGTHDVTHQQSPGGIKEYIPGLIDNGKCSFDINYVPGGTSEAALDAALVAGLQSYQVAFPNGKTWTFDAIMTEFAPKAPHDGKMTATVAFQLSGSITKA